MVKQENLAELESVFIQTMKRISQEWHKASKVKYARSHLMILYILKEKEEQRASELAKALCVTSGGITGLTDKLVNEGLIVRNRDTRDRRVVYFKLSDKGLEVLGELNEHRQRFLKNLFRDFSSDELNQMAGFYTKMLGNLDKPFAD